MKWITPNPQPLSYLSSMSPVDLGHNAVGLGEPSYSREPFHWVKTEKGHYTEANDSYAQFLGIRDHNDLKGQVDDDLFPGDLSSQYRFGDQQALTGESTARLIELVPSRSGDLNWCLSQKRGIRSRSGKTIATSGTMIDVTDVKNFLPGDQPIAEIVRFLLAEYHQPLTSESLASQVSLSTSQLNRRFRDALGASPMQFLTRVRLVSASQLLTRTSVPLSQISLQLGYYDQSHFANAFLHLFARSPGQYRKRFGSEKSPAGGP